MLAQAQRMEADAKGLLSEAARMKKDAERMYPGVNTRETKVSVAPETAVAPAKRGRPKKVAAGHESQ
jgi:hypothetical protein